jgi:hypothetical protein
MATIEVTPLEFTLVGFDADRIAALARDVADKAGFGSATIEIDIDETTPLGRSRVESDDPIRLRIESGAFEDPRHPRQMSDVAVTEVIGRHLLKLADRQDPRFGAPDEETLDIAHQVAWEIYAVGRLARFGYRDQRQRWLYHFRNRCGFSDATDAAFEAIWSGDDLTWAEISALVDGAVAGSTPVN